MSRVAAAAAAVVANGLVLLAFLDDRVGLGDVLLVTWWDTVLVGLATLWKVTSAEGEAVAEAPAVIVRGVRPGHATWFLLLYGGALLVLLPFLLTVTDRSPSRSGAGVLVLLVVVMVVSQVAGLVQTWEREGRRLRTSPAAAATSAYPRLAVVWVGTIACFVLLVGGDRGPVGGSWGPLAGVVVMVALVLACDLDDLLVEDRVRPGTLFGLGVGPPSGRRRRE